MTTNHPATAALSKPCASGGPAATWPHRTLYDNVVKALYYLPQRFQTEIRIKGIDAPDLFSFTSPLGSAIEKSVVEGLNAIRDIWDPSNIYGAYRFVRQPQAFPDVRLETQTPNAEKIILGIELKGWFVLAKEGEPSFRYKVNPDSCAPADLLAIFPWSLDETISGKPVLLDPLVTEAKYAAEHRNYYWRTKNGAGSPVGGIKDATHRTPYPSKNDKYNDEAENDAGKNFGRVARGGFLEEWVRQVDEIPLSGIPVKNWRNFLKDKLPSVP